VILKKEKRKKQSEINFSRFVEVTESNRTPDLSISVYRNDNMTQPEQLPTMVLSFGMKILCRI
jgi:hypothetical protein